MIGRRVRWLLVGGTVAVGVGCTRNTNPAGFAQTPAATGKAMWGGSPATTPQPQVAAADPAPARKAGQKGLMPDTEVEFANTHVESALRDPAPPNKDELLDLARHRYQRALKQEPKNKGALLGLARMHIQLGERDRAAEAFKRYLEAYPADAAVHHEAAMACARFQDWAGAVAWCEAALRLDPENRAFRKTLGFCLARAGRWEEAFGAMCRVMPEAQARYNMAAVLLHMNQPEASRQQLQLALRADPQHANTRDLLAELDHTHPANPAAAANPIQTVGGVAP